MDVDDFKDKEEEAKVESSEAEEENKKEKRALYISAHIEWLHSFSNFFVWAGSILGIIVFGLTVKDYGGLNAMSILYGASIIIPSIGISILGHVIADISDNLNQKK